MSFSEEQFEKDSHRLKIERFLKLCADYETKEVVRLQKLGWKYTKVAYRTVVFSIGEVRLKRKVLTKNGKIKKPLDEWLGLEKYARFSPNCVFQVAEVLTDLSYRKTGRHLERLKGLEISKDTVREVRKLATALYKERDTYREYWEPREKRQVKRLYIEGDGLFVKAKASTGKEKIELTHFVVHEGVREVNGEKRLIHKHQIIKANHHQAKKALLDYLDSHYEVSTNTLLITNSDMGVGYGASVFKEISSFLGCRWEHFWDEYHLCRGIRLQFKLVPEVFTETFNPEQLLISALYRHEKKEVRCLLDTVASRIQEEEKLERFEKFSQRLLRYFQYTKPAVLRGFSHEGIGVIESQNALIADRMKRRRMSWTVEGAETVAQMIIEANEGTLIELFQGEWRKEWERLKEVLSVSYYVRRKNRGQVSIRQVRQANKSGRRLH